MKKIMFACISVTCIIALFGTTKTAAQSIVWATSPYSASLVISSSVNTNNPIIVTSSISSFDQIFTNPGSDEKKIKSLSVAQQKIESNDPVKRIRGIQIGKVYVSMGETDQTKY